MFNFLLLFKRYLQGGPTRDTLPHVGSQGHVVRTGTGEFRRLLVDHGGGKAKKLTATIHTVTISAPVSACRRAKLVIAIKFLLFKMRMAPVIFLYRVAA